MRDIYLDKNGGLDFKTIIDRSDEVLQSIRIILEKNFNARYATQAIHDALEQDNRIGVLSVEVVPDFYKRTALAKLTLTVDGEAKKTEVALNVG